MAPHHFIILRSPQPFERGDHYKSLTSTHRRFTNGSSSAKSFLAQGYGPMILIPGELSSCPLDLVLKTLRKFETLHFFADTLRTEVCHDHSLACSTIGLRVMASFLPDPQLQHRGRTSSWTDFAN